MCLACMTKEQAIVVLERADKGLGSVRIPIDGFDMAMSYCPNCLSQVLYYRELVTGNLMGAACSWRKL